MNKTAFIFPGQGAQKCGMGKDFYENSELAKEIFDTATAELGLDMTKLCFEENDNWEPLIKERAISNLKGTESYTELTKEDIDRLVNGFKELVEKVNG